MRKTITKNILESMIDKYNQGYDLKRLSVEFGFQPQTIQRHFQTKGIHIVQHKVIRFTDDEVKNLTIDYKNGLRPFELAKKYNRSFGSIVSKLQSLGLYQSAVHTYTDSEIDILKEYYQKGDWDGIFKLYPKANKAAIYSKMSQLGVCAEAYYQRTRWRESEIQILKEHYHKSSLEELHKLLPNRTVSAIRAKALTLNLGVQRYWNETDELIMKQNYTTHTVDEMCVLLPHKTRQQIIAKARRLGLKNGCKYQQWEEDFISEHWRELSDLELAKALNRSLSGMRCKRAAMGFSRRKDGSSYEDIYEYLRRNNITWKKASMQQCHYKCVLTGKRFDEIHHLYGFNTIVKETFDCLKYDINKPIDAFTESELRLLLDTFRKIQAKYPLGICLTKEIHQLFHRIYGYGNNTAEQWQSFVEDYHNKKFDNQLYVA